jgi:hypothetical protein
VQGARRRVEKISVSVETDALRRAKLLAKRNGVSLSRLVTEAIARFAEEEERRAAARDLIASFPREARGTAAEKEAFRTQWSTPHVTAPTPRKRRAAG